MTDASVSYAKGSNQMHAYLERREIVVFPDCHVLNITMFEADDIAWHLAYIQGYRPARYPVPVCITDVVQTGFVMSGTGSMRGVPYIWVASIRRLWTFWKNIGLVEEWFASDGQRRLRRYVNHSVRGD